MKFAAFALPVLLMFPAFSAAQTTQPAEEETDAVRVHEGGNYEYKSLDALGLTPEQKAAIDQKVAERTATLKAWVASDKGKAYLRVREQIAEARRNKQADKVGPLRREAAPLAADYTAVRVKTRLAILEVLTPEQLARYVGQSLRNRATRGWESVELTDAQSAEIDKITTERAGQYLKDHPLADDAYLTKMEDIRVAVRKELAQNVLTARQRDALAARSATRPTTKPNK